MMGCPQYQAYRTHELAGGGNGNVFRARSASPRALTPTPLPTVTSTAPGDACMVPGSFVFLGGWGAHSGLLEDSPRTVVWPDSVQVSGRFALFWAAHLPAGVAHFRSAARRAPLTRRGSRGDCPARSSTAHLGVPIGTSTGGSKHMQHTEQVIIGLARTSCPRRSR